MQKAIAGLNCSVLKPHRITLRNGWLEDQLNVSNPAQNRWPGRVIVKLPDGSIRLNPAEVQSMEPYRPSLRRRLASARESLGRLLAMFKPQTQEVRSNRMCPFCGLITPRAKRVCLECGKSLNAVSPDRREAEQG